MDGPDEALGVTVVANGPPDLLDPAGDGGLADEPATPDAVHQFFLGHQPVAVFDEIGEHLEGLRLHRDPLAGAAQFEDGEVELQFIEADDHVPEGPTAARCADRTGPLLSNDRGRGRFHAWTPANARPAEACSSRLNGGQVRSDR